MSLKSELHCIESEIQSIKESQERIAAYKKELNNHNPFKIGDELVGNDKYKHADKLFVVDSLFVSSWASSIFMEDALRVPKYFVASGCNLKVNKELGAQIVQRSVKISDVI